MVFMCGIAGVDRAAAVSLAKLGPSALPDLETMLDSIEKNGRPEGAIGAGWLLLAYSRIKGRDAMPRLRRMSEDPKLDFLLGDMDYAIALSLGLTSYVSGAKALSSIGSCIRPVEPRHALNQLILAWQRDDQEWLEKSLGKTAKRSLKLFQPPRTDGNAGAVGYTFEISHRWSEPHETLDEERSYGDSELDLERPEINTRFKNSSGVDCGVQRIRFVQTPEEHTRKAQNHDSLPYLVDSADIAGLLRLIDTCASQ